MWVNGVNYSFKYEPKLGLFFCESIIYLHMCVMPAWDCIRYEIHQEKLCWNVVKVLKFPVKKRKVQQLAIKWRIWRPLYTVIQIQTNVMSWWTKFRVQHKKFQILSVKMWFHNCNFKTKEKLSAHTVTFIYIVFMIPMGSIHTSYRSRQFWFLYLDLICCSCLLNQ